MKSSAETHSITKNGDRRLATLQLLTLADYLVGWAEGTGHPVNPKLVAHLEDLRGILLSWQVDSSAAHREVEP